MDIIPAGLILLLAGQQRQFTASAPTVAWGLAGAGTLDRGLYTAPEVLPENPWRRAMVFALNPVTHETASTLIALVEPGLPGPPGPPGPPGKDGKSADGSVLFGGTKPQGSG